MRPCDTDVNDNLSTAIFYVSMLDSRSMDTPFTQALRDHVANADYAHNEINRLATGKRVRIS